MRKATFLAAALILAACSRNPEPDVDASAATMGDTTMSDTTMMSGDSASMGTMPADSVRATGDSALVNQDGANEATQQTMEADSVMGDSTLTGQANDTGAMGDSTMMHGDSAMSAPDASPQDALPTDSTQGQTP